MHRAICPDCQSTATIYATKPQTKLVRDLYCACDNLECRGSFKVVTEIVSRIHPPITPAIDVILPQSARFRAKPPETPPTPANDSDQVELAEA